MFGAIAKMIMSKVGGGGSGKSMAMSKVGGGKEQPPAEQRKPQPQMQPQMMQQMQPQMMQPGSIGQFGGNRNSTWAPSGWLQQFMQSFRR
jgi:hypothetical protein